MTGKTVKQQIADAKKRIADKKKLCSGCFGPRGNLITKFHREKVWDSNEIRIDSNRTRIFLPCKACSVTRFLELGSVSITQLEAEMQLFDKVILLKDGKYNVFSGFGDKKPVELGKFI